MAEQLSKLSGILLLLEDAVRSARNQQSYTIYLTALGPTVRQHLILQQAIYALRGMQNLFLVFSASSSNCSMPFVS